MANRIRRIVAVGQHIVEGFKAGDGLVLAEGDEEIGEFVFRDFELLYCFFQSYKNRVTRIAFVACIEFGLPLVEQGQRGGGVSYLVA